jgi:hypothetical protein
VASKRPKKRFFQRQNVVSVALSFRRTSATGDLERLPRVDECAADALGASAFLLWR